MVSVIWNKRALPIYWLLLDKKAEATPRAVNAQGNAPQAGSSNFYEQVATIRPVLKLLKDYKLVLIGDREYRSTALALWLTKKKMDICWQWVEKLMRTAINKLPFYQRGYKKI